jgi:hypothetical protein
MYTLHTLFTFLAFGETSNVNIRSKVKFSVNTITTTWEWRIISLHTTDGKLPRENKETYKGRSQLFTEKDHKQETHVSNACHNRLRFHQNRFDKN